MNVSNPYGCLITYIPGYGYDGYLEGGKAKHWGEDQFEEMLEWKRQYIPKTEPDPSKAPGKYDPNDTFERRELTKKERNELAVRLARKYDPCHMTQEEYDSFLDELVEEGLLSENQLGLLGYHGCMVLGTLDDMKSGWGSVSITSASDRSNPFYQRYGYVNSLSDANGNALAYATVMSLMHPAGGSAGWLNYAGKKQSNYETMADILQAMQYYRQRNP